MLKSWFWASTCCVLGFFRMIGLLNPISLNIHIQNHPPNWIPYISLRNWLREFVQRSKHFPLADHFIDSPNLFSWLCIDIVRRILTGIGQSPLGLEGFLKCHWFVNPLEGKFKMHFWSLFVKLTGSSEQGYWSYFPYATNQGRVVQSWVKITQG